MPFEKLTQTRHFFGVFSGDAELSPPVRQGIFHSPARTHRHAFLDAGGTRNPCLPFQVFPWNIEAFGPDESEDVCLASVLSHEGRRETETAAGLKIRCRAEDRGRQQVDFVVDDQAPRPGPEEFEMRERGFAIFPPRQYLVGCKRHWARLLLVARIFSDVVRM